MNITEGMINALSLIEQVYFEHGQIPTNEFVADSIGVNTKTVEGWWKKEQFRSAVQKRGVSLASLTDAPTFLSLEQLSTASMLLNTYDKRSIREKLEELHVTPNQLNNWMRDAKFSSYLRKRAENQFAEADAAAYMTMLKAIEGGDMAATKLFFEMKGIYNPRIQVDVNVDMVLMRVIEIISKHVKDPATLALIADDIEAIDGVTQRSSSSFPAPLPPVESFITPPSPSTSTNLTLSLS